MGIDVLSPVEQARESGPAPLPPPAAAEQPVFTDPVGRRARVVTLAGRALACLLLLWLIAVAASTTLNVYAHRIPGADRDAANLLGELIGPGGDSR